MTRNDFQVRFVNRQTGLVCCVLYHGALVAMMGGRVQEPAQLRCRMAIKAEQCISNTISGRNEAVLAVITRLKQN